MPRGLFRYTLESEFCVFVWLFVCLFVCLHKWKLNWKWISVWQKLQPLWLEFYTFHFRPCAHQTIPIWQRQRLVNLKVSYKKVFRAKFQIFCPTFFHAHFCVFTGIFLDFFSRALIWFSRVSFGDFFHGQNQIFTCTFWCNFRFFHVHFSFFTCKKLKISEIFTGVFFFFTPKKINTAGSRKPIKSVRRFNASSGLRGHPQIMSSSLRFNVLDDSPLF